MTNADAFDCWYDLMSRTFRLALPHSADRKMRAEGHIWAAGKHVLSEVECDGSQKWRDSQLIRADNVRYLKVRRYLTGGATLVTENDIWRLGPGATHLIDQSRKVIENSNHNRQFNLFISYDDIGYDPALLKECISLPDKDAGGALVERELTELMTRAATLSETKLDTEIDRFIHVVRIVLEHGAETHLDARMQTARRRLVLEEIGRYALTPGLTVDRLLAALPFSRATVYRDFAENGGIARAVRRQRMLAAWHRLASADATTAAVESTAFAVGFGSIHSFSHTFKRETGLRPSDVAGVLNRSIEGDYPAKFTNAPQWNQVARIYDLIRSP